MLGKCTHKGSLFSHKALELFDVQEAMLLRLLRRYVVITLVIQSLNAIKSSVWFSFEQ